MVYGEDIDCSVIYQTSHGALELQQKVRAIINTKNLSEEDFNKALKLYNDFLALSPQKMDSPEYVNEIPSCLITSREIYDYLLMCVTGRHNLRTNKNIKSVIELADQLAKQLVDMKIPNYTAKGAGMNYSIAYGGDTNRPDYIKMMEGLRYEDRKMRYQYAIQDTQWYLHRYFEMTLDRLKDPFIKWHREGVEDQEWIIKDHALYVQMAQMISTYPALMELGVLTPTKRNP